MTPGGLEGRSIAVTGERRAQEQAALVRALGGEPFLCPTARVAWEPDDTAPERWTDAVLGGADDVVFMTGMGTERLLAHVAEVGRTAEVVAALAAARVTVRGSKAQPVLRRHGVRVDLVPKPATSTGVLHALGSDLTGRRAVLQLAGPEPSPLADGMRAAGAEVVAVCLYRYQSDAIVGAADPLVDAILRGQIDAVTFTSAAAVDGLVAAAIARGEWPGVRRRLNNLVVASVGPVTTAALARAAVAVRVQPVEPRMGPLMREVAASLSTTPPRERTAEPIR